jgi:hypothetical protein
MKWCPDCRTYLIKRKEDKENNTYARPYWCEWCKDYKDESFDWKPSRKIFKYLSWTLLGIIALGILKAFLL